MDETDETERRPITRRLFIIGAVVAVAVAAITGRHLLAPPQPPAPPRPAIGGPFSLVDHNAKTVSEADFRGQFMLVFFGYTYCPDVCPTALTIVADAIKLLGGQGDAVAPVFITIDPQRDTPEQLAMYVSHFHPRLVGLTGTPEQLTAAAKAYKVYYAKAPHEDGDSHDFAMDHSSVIYLIGPDGKYLDSFGTGASPEIVAARLREFL